MHFTHLKFFGEGDGLTGGTEETSENMSGAAEPNEDEGGEVVYTSKDQLDGNSGNEDDSEDNQSEEAEPANQQSPEDNARYAAIRRRAEAEAERRFAAQQAAIDAKYKQMFGNYKNPVTGKPIESAADYAEAMAAQARQQQEAQLKEAGLDPQMINRAVEQEVQNSPVIRQAQEVLQAQQQSEANRMIAEDVENIHKIDPTVNGLEDLKAQNNFPDVIQYVQTHAGVRLSDAYKLINFERLSKQKQQAAQQSAINQAKSKGHLNAAAGLAGNVEGVDIPENELAQWREWFPEYSDKDLRKLYNASKNKTKR